MTADKPTHLVPKLRFPEFQDDPPWSALLLADLYEFKRTNTLSRDKLNYVAGTIRNIHYGDIHTKFNPLFQVREEHVPYVNPDSSAKEIDDDAFCKEGDIVLADASEDLNDVGKAIEVVSLDGERVVAGTHTILGTRRGSVPVVGFAGQLFQSAAVRARIKKEAQGAKVYGISAKRISAVPIPIPPTVAEQQKIADCLGSLDDLIAAEGRKLDSLRQHKQGLMQQLFPQPGETVPRLRFLEFRNAADWKTKILGTQGSFLSSLTGKVAKDFDTGDAAFIPYMNVFSNTFTNTTELRSVNLADDESQNAVVKGDVFFTVSSETPEEAGMSSVLLEEIGNCFLNSFCALFRFDEGKSPDPVFLGYLLRSAPTREHLSRGAQGATRYNISRSTFRSLPILIPTGPEQQKIADCLTSIDDQLNSQARKLDTLKQHKQGLQQQLFPSLEGQ